MQLDDKLSDELERGRAVWHSEDSGATVKQQPCHDPDDVPVIPGIYPMIYLKHA